MHQTFNRTLILYALADSHSDCGGFPPYSVSSIHYSLEQYFPQRMNEWANDTPYKDMKSIPSIIQLHRTMRDLLAAGLIVQSRIKQDAMSQGELPYWEFQYQVAVDVQKNFLHAECDKLLNAVNKAKHGFNFFGSILFQGLPETETQDLLARIKALMQQTHPDKVEGFEHQFKQLQAARKMIKDGIPLPVKAYTAGGKPDQPMRLIKL